MDDTRRFRHTVLRFLAWLVAAIAVVAAVPRHGRTQSAKLPEIPAAEVGDWLSGDVAVGNPAVFGNVVLFPILSTRQDDPGPLSSLDDAIAQGQAEVRELGDGRVGTLVIVNHGSRPIFVLAGTVVMGGKQDRQIGQDFIVGPKKTASVDAFCVEHGRWTPQRNGRSTGGKFVALKQLAVSTVRAAGQYEQSQGDVWAKVDEVNAAHDKRPGSRTLVATLGDSEIARRRDALAFAMRSFLDDRRFSPWIVGYAYAIDGCVRGARWFAHRRVFDMLRTTLLNTTAVDALTAVAAGAPATAEPVSPSAVKQFISEVDAAKDRKVRTTGADNANEYAASAKAYGSKTLMAPAKAGAAARVMSNDYVAK